MRERGAVSVHGHDAVAACVSLALVKRTHAHRHFDALNIVHGHGRGGCEDQRSEEEDEER